PDADPGYGLDHVARDHGVRFRKDAGGARVGVDAGAGIYVAHDVARAGREPAALVEIGDRNPLCRAVDDVVGDHRAGEGELREDRDFTAFEAGIAGNHGVVGGVEPDGREGAVAQAVAADGHGVGAEYVDAVAVLTIAAAIGADVVDIVVRDDGAVVPAGLARPDADAAIAAVEDAVARDVEVGIVDGEDAGFGEALDREILEPAGSAVEDDAVADAFPEVERIELDVLAADQRDEPRIGVRRRVGRAIEPQ